MESVNSTTFIKRPPYMTDLQEKFLYTKESLTGRIFLGSYIERRYVPVLKEYRDVVTVSPEETDLQKDLDKLKKKWRNSTLIKWVGITNPNEIGFPEAYCFWVKLLNLSFGLYWFQIKHVKLQNQEIFLQLKCIRKLTAPLFPVNPKVSNKQCETNNYKSEGSVITDSSKIAASSFDTQKTFTNIQNILKDAVWNLRSYLTWNVFVTVIKVGCAFLITIVMGTFSLIGHLGEFVLRLIREVTLLINAISPILIQVIDLLSKIVGGFYIILARMFFDKKHPDADLRRNVYSVQYSNAPGVSYKAPHDWRERNRVLRQELFSN